MSAPKRYERSDYRIDSEKHREVKVVKESEREKISPKYSVESKAPDREGIHDKEVSRDHASLKLKEREKEEEGDGEDPPKSTVKAAGRNKREEEGARRGEIERNHKITNSTGVGSKEKQGEGGEEEDVQHNYQVLLNKHKELYTHYRHQREKKKELEESEGRFLIQIDQIN
jgi:hypothetical protein